MRRSPAILLGLLAAGGALFAAAYFLAHQICARQINNPADDLDWLRQEFRLSETELARIRELHEGYLPLCAEMCRKIAVKKRELETVLEQTPNLVAAVESKLMELGELRAHCQARMLEHFLEVSRAMPPEQGRRYLTHMQRLTLGFHEQIEQSMSEPPPAHGHH
ncbi:MAG: periplasmic heavy metal sensor [Verrucomicrobiae bacterium]|nr:periplasmic heavy metal sensor [Verrucomicrobiae bacterium]